MNGSIVVALWFCVLATTTHLSTSFSASSSSSNRKVKSSSYSQSSTCSRSQLQSSASTETMASAKSLLEACGSYKKLVERLQTISRLQQVSAVIGYDEMVFMPEQASKQRGLQKSALAEIVHEKTTDPKLKQMIEDAQKEIDDKDMIQGVDEKDIKDARRLLEIEKKSFDENERVSKELAAKAAALSSSAYSAWVKARQENDFASFAPVLQDCFDTCKEVALAKRGDNTDIAVYTQMLDQFETGTSQARIDQVFNQIQEALVPLIKKVLESAVYQKQQEAKSTTTDESSEEKKEGSILTGTFDVDTLKSMCEEIVTKIGFNKEKGRMDVSVHPFTTSFSPADVRITTRYKPTEWFQGLAGMMHETGHAMYEQNLGDSATALDTALSMGAHESQSLFWERHIGLTLEFWKWALPNILKTKFPDHFKDVTAEQVYQAVNTVEPSFIRVEADELTYPLHVILRYKIEKDVIDGGLAITDLPARWNKEMKELLNVDVPSDTKGCLQDIHWASLALGYFPTYLLGAATAAQLDHYCRKSLPNMSTMIEEGQFEPIREWLTATIHRHGKRYKSLDEMLEAQVGEKLNPQYLIDYLTEKYSKLYEL